MAEGLPERRLRLRDVEVYNRIPGTSQSSLEETHFYVRLTKEGEPAIIVQDGSFWTDGGELLAGEIPQWFWDSAKNISEEKRRLVGLVLPEERKEEPQALEPDPLAELLRDEEPALPED